MMAERPIFTLNKPDVALEMTLRLSIFSEFTGQAKVKERSSEGKLCEVTEFYI